MLPSSAKLMSPRHRQINGSLEPLTSIIERHSAAGRRTQPIVREDRRRLVLGFLGYRRKLDSRFSLNLTGRDLLNSFRIRSAYDTTQFRDQSGQHLKLRSVLVGLTYTLGSTPRRQPEQFDFSTLPTAGS